MYLVQPTPVTASAATFCSSVPRKDGAWERSTRGASFRKAAVLGDAPSFGAGRLEAGRHRNGLDAAHSCGEPGAVFARTLSGTLAGARLSCTHSMSDSVSSTEGGLSADGYFCVPHYAVGMKGTNVVQ
jgi:hypothetical protein